MNFYWQRLFLNGGKFYTNRGGTVGIQGWFNINSEQYFISIEIIWSLISTYIEALFISFKKKGQRRLLIV